MSVTKVVVALAVSMSLSGIAHAHDEKKEHAHPQIASHVSADVKAEASAGDKAFAEGNLQLALESYGEAYAKSQDEDLLVAIARVHAAAKRKGEAKQMYTAYLKSGSAELSHRAEAEGVAGKQKLQAEAKAGAKGVGGLVGGVANTVEGAVGATTGLLGSVKVDVSAEVKGEAQAKAEEGDQAYSSGKFEAAASAYAQAYEKEQTAALLFARGMAEARAEDAVEARALLRAYLTAEPKGSHAAEAKASLLAMGGTGEALPKLNLKAKAKKEVKADVAKADSAYKAGDFLDAARIYGEAHGKASADAALLYGKGMSLYASGQMKAAREALKAYLASQGKLEFKAQAEATLASAE